MTSKRKYLLGYAAAVLSAVLFSIKGIFAKKAYALGATPEILLGIRFGFALPVFSWIALKSPEGLGLSGMNRKDWIGAGIVSALGYVLASLMDFRGLQYISVGLERVILYVHPTMLLLLSIAMGRKSLRRSMIPALLLSYLGLALCFLGEIHVVNPVRTLHGALLVFSSAAMYALFLFGAEDIAPRIGTHRLTALGMVLAGLIFGVQAGMVAGAEMFHQPSGVYFWSLGMAVLCTIAPVYLFGVGLNAMGAARLSIASMMGPVAVLPLAAIFLGERSGLMQWGGFGPTLAGGMLLMRK